MKSQRPSEQFFPRSLCGAGGWGLGGGGGKGGLLQIAARIPRGSEADGRVEHSVCFFPQPDSGSLQGRVAALEQSLFAAL